MMAYIFVAGVLVWFGVIMYLGIAAMEAYPPWNWAAGAAGLVVLVLSLGAILNATGSETRSGPCLRYETGMHYNPATKTMMPYRRCAERGEWITEGME